MLYVIYDIWYTIYDILYFIYYILYFEQTFHDVVVNPSNVISDHSLISWRLSLQHQPPIFVHWRTRQWMKLDKDGFRDALLNSELCSIDSRPESAMKYFDTYHRVLTTLTDQFAPVKKITVRRQQIAAWITMNVVNFVANQRRLERRYRKTLQPADQLAWVELERK